MKHVIYDYQIFLQQTYGGISRYFYELARRINKTQGFSAEIFAPLHTNAYLVSGNLDIFGRRVRKVPKIWRGYQAIDVALTAAYLALRRPSIVHETYYSGRFMTRKACPVVVTVYDMIHEKFQGMFKTDDRTSILKRRAVEFADMVICISENTRRDLIEIFDVPEDKTVSIALGFELDAAIDDEVKDASRAEAGPHYLLYVGSRDFHKNFSGFLEAFASSHLLRNNYSIVAFGGPPLSTAEAVMIDRLAIPRHKIIWRTGNDAALSALYRGADAFVYPSLYEGFGIPPLEAMSRDCPVICSNTSSIPEVVGDAAALFDPGDIDAMRATIERVVGSEDVKSLLIERGRRRVEKFSWDQCAAETALVYTQLLE